MTLFDQLEKRPRCVELEILGRAALRLARGVAHEKQLLAAMKRCERRVYFDDGPDEDPRVVGYPAEGYQPPERRLNPDNAYCSQVVDELPPGHPYHAPEGDNTCAWASNPELWCQSCRDNLPLVWALRKVRRGKGARMATLMRLARAHADIGAMCARCGEMVQHAGFLGDDGVCLACHRAMVPAADVRWVACSLDRYRHAVSDSHGRPHYSLCGTVGHAEWFVSDRHPDCPQCVAMVRPEP